MHEDMAVMGAGHTNLTQRGESTAFKVIFLGFEVREPVLNCFSAEQTL